jgi:ferredoxin
MPGITVPAAVAATPGAATSGPAGHTLHVDWTRCVGHGVCAAALGERVGLDRWGYPTVATAGVDVPTSLLRAARLAVNSCPAAALRLQRAERR